MGERYWITGVQLGMLIAFADIKEPKETKRLIHNIIDKQFIGNTNDLKVPESVKDNSRKLEHKENALGSDQLSPDRKLAHSSSDIHSQNKELLDKDYDEEHTGITKKDIEELKEENERYRKTNSEGEK